MSLFPQCSFDISVPGAVLEAGARTEGTLTVTVPFPIPRAQRIDLWFKSEATADYGTGNSRTTSRDVLFESRTNVALPSEPLANGVHRFPFVLELPAWLPPALKGPECEIRHSIEARVDVDWAVDPVTHFDPIVRAAPRDATRQPFTGRSPPGFHDEIVIELTLESSVVVQGEPVRGHVALRAGHTAKFNAVQIALLEVFHIVMARGDQRKKTGPAVRIASADLAHGGTAPFSLTTTGLPPTSNNRAISHAVALLVTLDLPWSFDKEFTLDLDVLPKGSRISGALGALPIGRERLQRVMQQMVSGTSLRPGGAVPVLAEGEHGPVSVHVLDDPRGGSLGALVELAYPKLDLGTRLGPIGLLSAFSESPLLPEPLRAAYSLTFAPPRDARTIADAALASFAAVALEGAKTASAVTFTDERLSFHFAIGAAQDSGYVKIARFADAKAKALASAIDGLPFPEAYASHRRAWSSFATAEGAAFVPSTPSIVGLSFTTRVQTGDERVFPFSIVTLWPNGGPTTRIEVDASQSPPKGAARHGEWVVEDGRRLVLVREGFTDDPRALAASVEAIVEWVLESRGEAVANAPYR